MALDFKAASRRTVLATAVIAGAALFGGGWGPASAQTTGAGTTGAASATYPGAAECAKRGRTRDVVNCEIDKIDRDTERLKREAEAQRQQAAAAREQDACGKYLLQGVTDHKWTLQEILGQANGKFTPDNVCGVARQRGYGRSAALN